MKRKDILLGGGCFWCLEAIYQRVPGVVSVEPGYAGGDKISPTYEEVCSGLTGHAEVVRVTYDLNQTSLEKLLEIFWRSHDPTSENRQGNDVGPQYRSIVLYTDEEERKCIENSLRLWEKKGLWNKPFVTEVVPAKKFYPAESYHHNYYNRNSTAPYCQIIIAPKLAKLESDLRESTSHSV
jgi:peptide-methionine (S)-S-oxide reductase